MKWRLYNKVNGAEFVGSDKEILDMYAAETDLDLKELDELTALEIAEELFGKHASVEKFVD
jgi:hypothetical protein